MLQSKPTRNRRVRLSPSSRARLAEGVIRTDERDRFVAAAVISLRLR